jgi:Peptidase family M41
MLGGRAAEEIALGEVTTGAENDLVEATHLARRMVTRWEMRKLGLAAFKADEQQPFLGCELSQGQDYSEATAALIDQEVQHLLEERHAAVRCLLTSARGQLDRLAHRPYCRKKLWAKIHSFAFSAPALKFLKHYTNTQEVKVWSTNSMHPAGPASPRAGRPVPRAV